MHRGIPRLRAMVRAMPGNRIEGDTSCTGAIGFDILQAAH